MTEPEFVNGKKYRCKVIEGSGWDRSSRQRTPFFRVVLLVTGGPMEDKKLIREAYFKSTTEESVVDEFRLAFDLDLRAVNLRELDQLLVGRECAAQVEIQKRQDGKGENIRANRLMPVTELIPGGIESEVAFLLSNKATPDPDPNEYSDQF